MAKAVALAKDWEYTEHNRLSHVLNEIRRLTRNPKLPGLRSIADELHGHYFERKRHLEADSSQVDLDNIAKLLDILEQVTEWQKDTSYTFRPIYPVATFLFLFIP